MIVATGPHSRRGERSDQKGQQQARQLYRAAVNCVQLRNHVTSSPIKREYPTSKHVFFYCKQARNSRFFLPRRFF
jgi:hypothetical protein